jgi:hypothetical protein
MFTCARPLATSAALRTETANALVPLASEIAESRCVIATAKTSWLVSGSV